MPFRRHRKEVSGYEPSARALLYPLLRENVPILRHRQLVLQSHLFDIAAAVSPAAYFAQKKDAAFLDEGEPTGLLVSEDFRLAAKDCDCVILTNCNAWENSDFLLEIVDNLIWACQNKKPIYWIVKLPEPYHSFFSSYTQKYAVTFSALSMPPISLKTSELEKIDPLHSPNQSDQ